MLGGGLKGKGRRFDRLLRLFELDHTVQRLQAAFRGDDVALAVPAALVCHEVLDALDLLLLLEIVLHLRVALFLLFALEYAVRAAEHRCARVLQLQRFRRDAVEEIAVVRNDEEGLFRRTDKLLQPLGRFKVEMVGRLVEQKDVGVRNEHRQKRQPCFLAAAEQGGRFVEVCRRKAEALEHRARFGLVFVAARAAEFLLQRGVARRVGAVPVGQPALQFGQPALGLVQAGKGVQRPVQHRPAAEVLLRLLGEQLRFCAARKGHVAAVGLQAAGEDVEQRGLARAVGPDDAEALAFVDREGYIVENFVRPVGERDGGNG